MPALPAAVSTYLTTVKNSLKDHASDDATVDVAPLQFIRAMHLSAALDLLQDACNPTATLVVVSGTTTSLTDGAATFVANTMMGSYVTFGAATTTVALRSKSYRVWSNTDTTLRFRETLAGTPVAGDTYTIAAGFLDEVVSELRDGRSIGNASCADGSGDYRLVLDGLVRGIRQLGGTLVERTMFSGLTTTGSTTTSIALNLRGGLCRVDEFRGRKLTLAGSNPVIVISNTEAGVCTVSTPVSGGAPGSGVAVTVKVPSDSSDFQSGRDVHPGGHQSSYVLADMLEQLQTIVVAFALPT